jgi:hypothetical protein
MSATMKNMELIFADFLSPDQLMEGDIIKSPDHEMVTVTSIDATTNGWLILSTNDFDETIEFEVADDAVISWYAYPPDED